MIESPADLGEFFDSEEFADTIERVNGEPSFAGIFHYPFERAELKREGAQESGLMVSVRYPRIITPTVNALTLTQHETVRVRGRMYDMVEFNPDGTGLTEIPLREESEAPEAPQSSGGAPSVTSGGQAGDEPWR